MYGYGYPPAPGMRVDVNGDGIPDYRVGPYGQVRPDVGAYVPPAYPPAYGGMYGFAEGGIAISNYIDENISEARSYTDQLAVPVSNGSKNFAIVYCDAALYFADNQAHVVKSMDVIGTTYLLGVIKNGDGYAKAMVDKGDYVNVVVTGYNGNAVTGTKIISLAKDGGFVTNWMTVDMSDLGKVDVLAFTMESNDVSAYGMKAPKYFAFDNVVIK